MTAGAPPTLHLVRGTPNPLGAADAQLYLLVGAAAAGPQPPLVPDAGPPPLLDAAAPFRLTIFHFSDLHHHLAELTPDGSRPVFARMVWAVRAARRRCASDPHAAVLFVAGGDDMVGTVFDELLMGDAGAPVHAGYRLYSAAGVDAAVVGNHDLDYGWPAFVTALRRDARFPALAANLRGGPASLPAPQTLAAGAILVLKGLRVGLIGVTTSAEMHHLAPDDFTVSDPVAAANRLAAVMRPLCDLLLVLSHLGYSLAGESAVLAGAGDVELAQALPPSAVDLIIGAHTHLALNEAGLSPANIVNGIPIVQAGANGRWLGRVQITVRRAGNGLAATVDDACLIPVADLPPDADFEAAHVALLAERARSVLLRPLGRTADHLDLDTSRVRQGFAAGESALVNFVADALAAACRAAGYGVACALVDASSVPCGLPRGAPLTFGDWFQVMPYADTLRLAELSVAQFRALLDDNARRADRPDEPHVERGFVHFSREVRYAIGRSDVGCRDVACNVSTTNVATTPAGDRGAARALDVTLDGVPLADLSADRRILVACSNFVRGLAGGWERRALQAGLELFDLRALLGHETGLRLRAVLLAHIHAHGGVLPEGGLQRDGRVRIHGSNQGAHPQSTDNSSPRACL